MIFAPVAIECQQPYVRNGLVQYLDAGITTSYPGTGSTWNDISGVGVNLSLVNSPTFNSTGGGYFDFAGVNQYISSYNYGINFSANNLTFVAVLQYFDKSASYHNIFDTFNSVNPMLWVNTTDKLEADQAAGYTTPLSYTGQTIQVAMVHSNTAGIGVKIYINGNLIGENTAAQGTISGTMNIFRRQTSGLYYKGRCYNLMFYNKVLTAAEVQQNYLAFKNRYNI